MKTGGLFQPRPGDRFIVEGYDQVWQCLCTKNGIFSFNPANTDERICFDPSAPFHRILEE